MRERPILFSGPMVRAILEGRKSQTRRLVNPQPEHRGNGWTAPGTGDLLWADGAVLPHGDGASPYGQPGDRLWVRENFAPVDSNGHKCAARDAAFVVLSDGAQKYRDGDYFPPLAEYAQRAFEGIKWRPSIHMPRWASRITLEVTAVRVERLQEISTMDAMAEGAAAHPVADGTMSYTHGFRVLWDGINGKRAAWDSNPWLWVVSFKRVGGL